ncbi:hypothetical protein CAPTEDRAFT_197058 [Capitella teleta]|uniref:Receptor L-domain domain-containing protein n=1 Tax=Capitella teleta TaxID=283909 RepID=R7V657_CAPTE|nr:hypothetical protein CAPTEDRAFT_197058 [Capitella teleta]|eukprot:ELU14064.1 hypothetical protein CAPTEDRAFT_197058 [Capitella teleta]
MDFPVRVLVCVLLITCFYHVYASCPDECVCLPTTDVQSGAEGYIVSCIDLTELPVPWPEDIKPVTEFYLSELSIDELPEGLFKDMDSVRRITIRFSKIGSLGASAFKSLSGLSPDSVLMLSFNDIGVVSSNAFNDLKNFASIQITGGSIDVIQENAFTDIDTGSLIFSGVNIGVIEANAISSISFHRDFSLPSALKSLPEEVLLRIPSLNSTGPAGCEDRSIKDSNTSFISLVSNTISSMESKSFSGIHDASLIVAYGNTIGLVSQFIFGESTDAYAVSFTNNAIEAMDDHAFGGLAATEKLVLFGNEISCYDPEALVGIEAVDVINQDNTFHPVDLNDNRTFCQLILATPEPTTVEVTTIDMTTVDMTTVDMTTVDMTTAEMTTENKVVDGSDRLGFTLWLLAIVLLVHKFLQ